eukprot:298633-Chlamydomonas_euryale.AAC.7
MPTCMPTSATTQGLKFDQSWSELLNHEPSSRPPRGTLDRWNDGSYSTAASAGVACALRN